MDYVIGFLIGLAIGGVVGLVAGFWFIVAKVQYLLTHFQEQATGFIASNLKASLQRVMADKAAPIVKEVP